MECILQASPPKSLVAIIDLVFTVEIKKTNRVFTKAQLLSVIDNSSKTS
jgi:hypothetical protein